MATKAQPDQRKDVLEYLNLTLMNMTKAIEQHTKSITLLDTQLQMLHLDMERRIEADRKILDVTTELTLKLNSISYQLKIVGDRMKPEAQREP